MDFRRFLDNLFCVGCDGDALQLFAAEFHEFEPSCLFYCAGVPVSGGKGLQDKFDHAHTIGTFVDDQMSAEILSDSQLVAADKFPDYCKNNYNPLVWNCDPAKIKDRQERRFFGLAADFGVKGGITIPTHRPQNRTYGNLTLFFDNKSKWSKSRLTSASNEMQTATVYLANSISGSKLTPPERGSLSARERDCISLLAAGYHTSQIADRLKLADATVNEYIGRARRKMGARTRAEAVARAVKFQQIQL